MLKKEEINQEKLCMLLNEHAGKELAENITKILNSSNIYYRLFYRTKSVSSIVTKLKEKDKKYRDRKKGMQDIIGIRIVLYYYDDIPICKGILENVFKLIPEDSEEDIPEANSFKPIRKNYIFHLPFDIVELFSESIWNEYRIEKTFEVQVRSIFSEGWYEVEHDIRYKHKSEWEADEYYPFNRELSTINATLEVCDRELVRSLDDLAYLCYKQKKVQQMLRYKLRIRLVDETISSDIEKILKEDTELLKRLYRMDRNKILRIMSHPNMPNWPHSLNNIIFLCNEIELKSEEITKLMPKVLTNKLQNGLKYCSS